MIVGLKWYLRSNLAFIVVRIRERQGGRGLICNHDEIDDFFWVDNQSRIVKLCSCLSPDRDMTILEDLAVLQREVVLHKTRRTWLGVRERESIHEQTQSENDYQRKAKYPSDWSQINESCV